ncbi:hypothetical protein VFPFJ_07664 [Purpureocillium lilacinum]|uniref:Uncharacterized protein n=1 Tax=Purpureocillium lilacinum TaxID=33203 RepID=A0A179GIT0_PURLI|nr:hypothetical protein VFPFJ_07664 [Purpureocillium lilacinum]OAQ77722.1 hypothetical protein VFPBJ_08194 [Purpureocillium lilacinum]OAQ85275.1 hypothetical protein VFPFJ_07664 [Purpureocillium lilacinum]
MDRWEGATTPTVAVSSQAGQCARAKRRHLDTPGTHLLQHISSGHLPLEKRPEIPSTFREQAAAPNGLGLRYFAPNREMPTCRVLESN